MEGGGVRQNITKCFMEEEGGLKSAKKVYVLLEWPLIDSCTDIFLQARLVA